MRFNDTDLDTWADEFERTGATGAALFTDDDLDTWADEYTAAENHGESDTAQPGVLSSDAAWPVRSAIRTGAALGDFSANVIYDVPGAALHAAADFADKAHGESDPLTEAMRKGGDWLIKQGKAAHADWASGREFAEDLVPGYRKGKDFLDDPKLLLNPGYMLEGGADAAGSMLPVIAAAMSVPTSMASLAGGVVGGFMEGGSMLAEQLEKGVDPTEAFGRSAGYGLTSTWLNKIGLDGILSPRVADGLARRGAKILAVAGQEALTEWLEGPVQAIAETAGKLPWVNKGVVEDAASGLSIARTEAEPKSVIQAVGKAAREEAAVIPGSFLVGGGMHAVMSSEAASGNDNARPGQGPARMLPTEEIVDLLDVVQEPAPAPPAPPAPPAAPSGGAGIGGRVNELAGQLQDLGSVPPVDEVGQGMGQPVSAPLPVAEEFDLTDLAGGASVAGPVGAAPVETVQPQGRPFTPAEISGMMPPMAAPTVVPPMQQQAAPAPQEAAGPGQDLDALIEEVAGEIDDIEFQAHQAATSPMNDLPEPTPAQKEAGNYKKAHVRAQGFDIAIENPAGSERKGIDQDGKPWSVTMNSHYGYIKGTVGADKDHLDVFLGPDPRGGDIFVVDQVDPATGKFDEHKVVMGAGSEDEARGIYLSNYEDGWQGLGAITRMPLGTFRKWARSSKTKRPVGDTSLTTTSVVDQSELDLGDKEGAGDRVDGRHLAVREQNAHRRFVDSAQEQFGLSENESWAALNSFIKNKLIKVDKNSGQYQLTHGDAWSADVLRRAAAEYTSSGKKQERDDEQRRPVEPGLEQHESGGVQQPAGGRTGERRVRGRRGTVHFPGGSEAFTYEVIDADELIPSHDPRTAFTPREDYGYVNERDYERNEYEQSKVVEHAMELEPDLLLADSPTAEHGGPLVDRNNRVLGGNSRAMTLQVAYGRGMDGASRYKSALVRAADRFGLDRAGVEAMERPVLVRAMDRGVEREHAQSLIPAFNAGFTQAVDPEALGVSRGAKVSDGTIAVLADGLEEGQTLRDYLAGPKAKRLVESLIEDGALDRTRLTVVMRGGEISPEGRDEIERVLRGRIVGDYGVIEGLQPSLLEALDASIPALVRLQGRGEGWDISKQFMAALRHVSRYRKNRSADGGSLDVYFRTPEMMGSIPGKKSRIVQILAHAIDNMGHAHLGKAMREFTTLAFAGQKSVAMLPGMGDLLPTRDQALEKFRTEKTPPVLFESTSSAPTAPTANPAGQESPPAPTERDEYAALFDEELAAAQSARLPKKESIAERQRRTRAVAKKVAKRPADVHAAQERAKAGAKKMAAGARAALDVFSKYGGLSVRVVKDGDAVNQGLYDELRPHLATVMQGAREMGLAGKDLAREVVRFLIRTFGDQAAQARPYFMKFVDEEILNKERGDVDQQRGGENLERDSGPGEPQDVVGAEGVQDGRGRVDRTGGQGVRGAGEQGRGPGGDPGVSGRPAPADGARGDSRVREEASGTEGRPSGSELGERGRSSDDRGLAPEPVADVAIKRAAERSSGRRITPGKAGVGEQKKGDLENIIEELPTLLPGQHQDVAFAEKRFEKGAGVMFTNGTGTGKTGSGLGIVQRLVRAGKKNILIAVPADSIAKAWISFAEKYLGLKVNQLKNTKDAGAGVVVTTHANMGMNKALASRNWDLIIMDEAHKSMSSEGAKLTRALQSLRALALHRDGYYELAKMRHPEAYAAAMDKDNQWRESDPQAKKDRALEIKRRWDDLVNEVKAEVQSAQDRVKARLDEDGGRPGVVFLSATPFAYAPNVDYAEGFLFDYPKVESRGYNQPNGQQAFMIQHFGYRMRTGKLTKPEADVDSGYMERQFNSWLKREGVLSSRMLDVEHDYDRRFVLVDSAVGRTIDEGLQWLRENKRFYPLADLINERFDYHARQYLLEAIKANEAVLLIRQHLDLGRKVVVFHDFKQGGGFNPFDVSTLKGSEDEVSISTGNGKSYTVTIGELASEFAEKRPDLQELPLASFQSPITTLSKAFPDLLLFNGDVSPKNRAAAIESFQDDASGKNLILVQSAAGEAGISLHDTTGKHQRVLINLGMPTRPVTAIQQEGRIFRVGQQSNAMFRYLNTGTSWERWAFAGTIARRASTAENLSLGEEARALRDGFIQAFEESDAWAPGHESEGTGGKDRDRAANQALTEWDRAKTMYFAQQRKNSRTKATEGVDYFATPEPLGLKMVEWAGLTAGMDVLEPSAGHGAIARWFPDLVGKTSVEPSHELASRLALVTDGRIVTGTFEGLHINNKYDAIVMNPPFGHGGKTAMEHVAKAFTHLREGGRIVAIVPEGPSMEKRFNAWYDSEDAKHAHLRMELSLPSVAFERAGTNVRAQVLVIDKAEKPVGDISRRSPSEVAGETVREFFDNLENRTAPERVQTEEGRIRQALEQADAERGVFFEAAETKHTKTGEDLFVAKKTGAVSYDAFRKIKGIAKARGGWWSNFNGKGAIPGFQFRERSKRDEFLELAAEVVQKETPGVRLSRRQKDVVRATGVKEAIDAVALAIESQGKVAAIVAHEELGDITVDWGHPGTAAKGYRNGAGLSHIVARRGLEGSDPASVLAGVVRAVAEGKVVREYGGANGRMDVAWGDYVAVLSKQRFGEAETWLLTGFMDASGAGGESYNPASYAPEGSVSRRQVGADFVEKLRVALDRVKPENQAVRRKGGAPAEGGLRASRVRSIVSSIAGSWARAPKVEVVQSVRDLPANLLHAVRKAGAEGDVQGIYHDGTIYLVADRMESAVHVHRTLLHEAAGHHGLRLIMTDGELNLTLDAAWGNRRVQEAVKEIAETYGLDLADADQRREAVEEVLANWAESGASERALDKFIAAVRRAIRRVLPYLHMSDAEIRDILVRARLAVEDGANAPAIAKEKLRTDAFKTSAIDTDASARSGAGSGVLKKITSPIMGVNQGQDEAGVPSAHNGKPRFARAVSQASATIGALNQPMTQAQIAAELEKDRTFANKVHEGRDLVRHQVQVTAADMQREVQRLAGSKRWRYNPFKVFSSEKELTDSARSRLLDAAMLVYRDLQANPGKAQEFRDWARDQLEVKRVKGRDRLRIMEQLRVLEASENLTNEQKDFVDSVMDSAFNAVGHQAASAGIVATLLDNYVRRLWNRPQDSEKGFSGAGHAFKVFTTASKARTLETIADGWMKGYDLQVKGITSSWVAIAGEIGEIVANKSFIQEGRRQGIFGTIRRAGYVPLKAKGFQVWTRKAGVKVRMAGNYGLLGADGQGRNLYVSPPKQVWAVYANPGDRRADTLFDREKDARDYADQLRQAGNPKALVEFRQDVDIFERVPLYAPARVAELINRMTRAMDGDSPWKAPMLRTILQFNAAAKSWILMTSFFHHMAGSRSWMFGINHGVMDAVRHGDLREAVSRAVRAMNPVSAHKRGLEKIKSSDAVLRQLIKHGLTVGELADWSEGILAEHRGLTERLFTSLVGRMPGAETAVAMVQAGKLFREKAANSLFKRLFAGLKAEAACVEFAHQMKQEIAEATKHGRTPNADLVAERVARLVNDDFGGMHLGRMGRNPSVQAALRLLLLAPDWTESNWRTVTGVIPGLNNAIARIMNEVPAPPDMESMYRRFWAGILLKGAASTLLLQIAITSIFGDDDDDWRDMYREQFADWDTFRRMKWTGVDVTPIYRRLGIDVPKGERKIFSVIGHFGDFLRLFDPESLVKGKLSPVARIVGALGTKTDFRQRPYTGLPELLETGRTVKKSYHQPTETFFSALPSILLAQARDIQPIQVGFLLKYLQGEEDGLSALLSSAGAHMKVAYAPDLVGREFEDAGKEIHTAYRRLKDLQELVRVHASMKRSDPAGARKLYESREEDFKEAETFLQDKAKVLKVREGYEAYQDALSAIKKARRMTESYQMDEARRAKTVDIYDTNMEALQKEFLQKYWRKAM